MGIATSTPAAAANFGFVRWPDWMDTYIWPLLGVTVVGILINLVLKPRDVQLYQIWKLEGYGVAKFVAAIYTVAFIVAMAMIFIGMGLMRS